MMTVRTMVRNVAGAIALGGFAALSWGQEATSPAEWSRAVWRAAEEGRGEAVQDLLLHVPPMNPEIGNQLEDSLALLSDNFAKTREQRETEITEARDALSKAIEAGEGIENLREALKQAVTLQVLMENHDEAAFVADAQVKGLITRAERAARAAEAEGRWLDANELYYRLDVLLEKDARFHDDVRRAGLRLNMIALYAPERWWEMRNERQIQEGEEALPPYNPLGDGYADKLDGIDRRMVRDSLERAAAYNVKEKSMADLLVGGLESLRTMATTEDLRSVFPGLDDDWARERFVQGLDDEIRKLETLGNFAGRQEMVATLGQVGALNDETVRLADEALLHEFGNGAMAQLDEFSSIIWPNELRRFERNTRGSFVGVGIQIQLDEQSNIKVVTPLEGTPAQRAGIRADDVIKAVNGESALGFTLDQAVDMITGPSDTEVVLTVERDVEGEKVERDFPIVRQQIPLYSVKGWERKDTGEKNWNWFIDPELGIGYVRLTSFNEQTVSDFDDALREMQREGLTGLILDLRFNPGGLLDQAVSVASRFIEPQGPGAVVVTTEDRFGATRETERVENFGLKVTDVPVVVLVNQGSASASEIVSGALQDYADQGMVKAIVLGQTSYGKGSVQNVWFIGRRNAALKLTTQFYRLPGAPGKPGRMIDRAPGHEHGVEPDFSVDMLPEQVTEALRIRRDADVIPLDENGEAIVQEDRPQPWDLIAEGHDLQLQAALVLLQTQHESIATQRAAWNPSAEPVRIP